MGISEEEILNFENDFDLDALIEMVNDELAEDDVDILIGRSQTQEEAT